MLNEDSPFFLGVKWKNFETNQGPWYYPKPLGKNKIGEFLSGVKTLNGINESGKKISNHTVRKTSISKLLDNGLLPHFVRQLSGHKHKESLKSDHTASSKHQTAMSDILNDNMKNSNSPFGENFHDF